MSKGLHDPRRYVDNGINGYAAAIFDLFGSIDYHPYAEGDGRVFLRITVRPFTVVYDIKRSDDHAPSELQYNIHGPTHPVLAWINQNFKGRLNRGTWEANGPRAALCLRNWQPYLLRNRHRVADALHAWEQRRDPDVFRRITSEYRAG